MKTPRTRLWIDAKGEKLNPAQHAEARYIIRDLDQPTTKEILVACLYPLVKEILYLDMDKNEVSINYNPSFISRSFIEYLLQQRGILFDRKDG